MGVSCIFYFCAGGSTSQIHLLEGTYRQVYFFRINDGNETSDTLVIGLTSNSAGGNFIFVINLFDKNGVIANETNLTLSSGINKINITFDSSLLSQSQFNYSVKIYNSTYSLK